MLYFVAWPDLRLQNLGRLVYTRLQYPVSLHSETAFTCEEDQPVG